MPRLWRQLHKTWHQDGGVDEISVSNLSGLLGDAQTPLAHKTSHQDGGADEINLSGLSGQQIFVPYNGKIADITHADTDKHYLTLANSAGTGAIAGETRKIVAITIKTNRMAGSGAFYMYPNEGTSSYAISSGVVGSMIVIADGTQRLQYNQTVAGDDWDVYCLGYVVEA
jgi:hypothetical protein